MSELLVTSIYNQEGEGAPSFPKGATVTGVITATSFSGSGANLTGIDATALKDDGGVVKIQANSTGVVVTGVVTATTGSFTSNVSVGGTLTYEDVTNIDSVGLITARSGVKVTGGDIQVGSATTIDNSGVNVTGVITATSFEGSGANLTNLPPGGNTISLVADGAIAAGKPCIVTSGGKVQQTQISLQNYTSAQINSTEETGSDVSYFDLCWNVQRDKLVLSSAKESGNKQGCGTVLTPALSILTDSLTMGTDQPYDTSDTEWTACAYDPDTHQTIFAWEDLGSSSYGDAVLGTLSGGSYTEMTYGTTVTFESNAVDSCKVVYDTSNDKAVIIYRMQSDATIKAIVGTISGTDISFGTAVSLDTNYLTDPGGVDACFDSSNNKVILAFHHAGDGNKAFAVVGTVSGTSISFGTPVKCNGNNAAATVRCCFDENTSKVVTVFADNSNSGYGSGAVGTVSGTSMTFGSVATYPDSIQTSAQDICYDPSSKNVFIFCNKTNSSNHGRFVMGTVSGTSISFPSSANLQGGQDPMYNEPRNWTIAAANNGTAGALGKVVACCRQTSNTNLKIYTFKTQQGATNFSSDNINFIGFAEDAISDGATGIIKGVENVVGNQSGLTPGQIYSVEEDGTLSNAGAWTTHDVGLLAIAADKGIVRRKD